MESSEKIKQKIAKQIEELKSICCEDGDRARQARIVKLSLHLERNPTTVRQLLTHFQDLQNKVNSFLVRCERIFYDPETASSSGATHVPSQPATIPSPRTMLCCDSGVPHDTQKIVGTSGHVSERPSAREGRTSTIFDDSKNLASSSQGLRPDITETARRESQYLLHASKVEVEC